MIGKPKLIVFASGTKDGGGSGFEVLARGVANSILNARIAAVVSNYADGGVSKRASRLGIPFEHYPAPWTEKNYQEIVRRYGAEWIALSGWLKIVRGLPPQKTFNIHPGPLPLFGGEGMYGHRVHEAILRAFREGKILHTEITMHFVGEEYDTGPVFFRRRVDIYNDDSIETLADRVQKVEHVWQPVITNLVVNGEIHWDGENPSSLVIPKWTRHFASHD